MNITTEIVREILAYNTDTGIFTWRQRSRDWFKSDHDRNAWNARYAGKEAGCVHTNVYRYPGLQIGVLGKQYTASRLAFLAMGEPLPEQVDHLSRDSLDNRWRNLKASTNAENMKNQSKRRDNTSGVTGVHWIMRRGKWQAEACLNGKMKYLGLFTDINDAAAAVATFYAENGFSAGHGQELARYMV